MPEGPGVPGLTAAVLVSAAGMAFHTVGEFGAAALAASSSGFAPFVGLQLALLAAWWRLPRARRGFAGALLATAVLQLVGGAIISVLPLAFLPFAPDQSLGHYVAHAVLGLAQLPLVAVALRGVRGENGPT